LTRRAFITSVRGTALLAVPLLLIAVWTDALAGATLQRVGVTFFLTLVLVLGLQTFIGDSGIVSFGQVAFMGLGAYTAALVTIPAVQKRAIGPSLPGFIQHMQLGLVESLALAAAVAAAAAALVGIVFTRMREDAFAMATIALLVIFFTTASVSQGYTGGEYGVYSIPQNVTPWIAAGFAIASALIARLFRESNAGRELRASREDRIAAASLGANVVQLRYVAWLLSATLMGIGGALFAEYNLAFDPSAFYFDLTFVILAMLVIGGPATVSGATLGAVVVTVADELLRRLENGTNVLGFHVTLGSGIGPIVIGLLILVILRQRPLGLLGVRELDEVIATVLARKRRLLPWSHADARS
jgi:branched-chain amino acid transport system permease protein